MACDCFTFERLIVDNFIWKTGKFNQNNCKFKAIEIIFKAEDLRFKPRIFANGLSKLQHFLFKAVLLLTIPYDYYRKNYRKKNHPLKQFLDKSFFKKVILFSDNSQNKWKIGATALL